MAFAEKGYVIDQVYSPNQDHSLEFAADLNCKAVGLDEVGLNSDLIILAVPDSKIAEVAKKLQNRRGIVVHTSGNTSINVLNELKLYGVFYPLQTFTKNRLVAFNEIPICIEAPVKNVAEGLLDAAQKLSPLVYQIDSRKRKDLHAAAVFVNNFTNYLYGMAADFLEDKDLDFELLKPLIIETAKKIEHIHPKDAQTGPARRGDLSTLKQQLELLNDKPEMQKLYQLISDQLMKKYHE